MTTVPVDARLRQLERDAPGYEFAQLVRLLARARRGRAALGGWADPGAEVVRLGVPPSLGFPPGEVAEISVPDAADAPIDVIVNFFGLTGPQGVLPHAYTSHVAARARARDTAFRDFLDLFHHRALSLFHRAWEHHRPPLAAEHGAPDRLREHLDDLSGFGTEAARRAAGPLAEAIPYYAGLFALRTRPAVGLAQVISDYFGVPAVVEQFVGEWRPLQGGGQMCLEDDGPDGRLGSAVIGDAVYDPQARVRLQLGPLTRAQFDAFLPSGALHEPLRQLARLYADDQVGIDAQLILARDDVPGTQLGTKNAPPLGFGTWLRSKPVTRDPNDVLLPLCS
jgi:type VI secretion system protein ImpH